ncbi:hypothetical protein BHE74_00027490 [Ensete ventricosum]|nr:hypothetical protein BHE74_00027490 [Ensete ventricosum]
MEVQHARDGAGVGVHPSDVAAGRERTELHPPGKLRRLQGGIQGREIRGTGGVEADLDHLSQALPPGEQVGVVLVGADEDDPPLGGRKMAEHGRAEDGGYGDPHHLLQPLDGGGGAGAAEEEHVVRACPHALLDVVGRLLHQLAGVEPYVAVHPSIVDQAPATNISSLLTVEWENITLKEFLDEPQEPAGSRVVRVSDAAAAERGLELGFRANDLGPQPPKLAATIVLPSSPPPPPPPPISLDSGIHARKSFSRSSSSEEEGPPWLLHIGEPAWRGEVKAFRRDYSTTGSINTRSPCGSLAPMRLRPSPPLLSLASVAWRGRRRPRRGFLSSLAWNDGTHVA